MLLITPALPAMTCKNCLLNAVRKAYYRSVLSLNYPLVPAASRSFTVCHSHSFQCFMSSPSFNYRKHERCLFFFFSLLLPKSNADSILCRFLFYVLFSLVTTRDGLTKVLLWKQHFPCSQNPAVDGTRCLHASLSQLISAHCILVARFLMACI